MADWADLKAELDRWRQSGCCATFWWRDDDAGPDDGKLQGFLAQRRRLDTALALATVPAWLAPPTVRRILADPGAVVLQHGWAHRNNASPTVKNAELADGIAYLEADLIKGRESLHAAFGARFQPVMVPPWNRIGPATRALLADIGYIGLSTHGARAAISENGIHMVNVHIDIIDWRTRSFCGDAGALAQAIDHLQARRTGHADAREPTGLMTHHRDHDEASGRFVDRFVTLVRDHDAGRWLDARILFGTRQEAA